MQLNIKLNIAKTNDIDGAYRLAYRVLHGNALDGAQAFLEVTLLNEEAKSRFHEVISRKTYNQYLPAYLTIAAHHDKLLPLLEQGIIHGDRIEQMCIAFSLACATPNAIAEALGNGSLKPNMYLWDVNAVLPKDSVTPRRQTSKINADHEARLFRAHRDFIRDRISSPSL